jgi:hypothetical protein
MNENNFGLNENVSEPFQQHHKLFLWALIYSNFGLWFHNAMEF